MNVSSFWYVCSFLVVQQPLVLFTMFIMPSYTFEMNRWAPPGTNAYYQCDYDNDYENFFKQYVQYRDGEFGYMQHYLDTFYQCELMQLCAIIFSLFFKTSKSASQIGLFLLLIPLFFIQ